MPGIEYDAEFVFFFIIIIFEVELEETESFLHLKYV